MTANRDRHGGWYTDGDTLRYVLARAPYESGSRKPWSSRMKVAAALLIIAGGIGLPCVALGSSHLGLLGIAVILAALTNFVIVDTRRREEP